MLEQKRTM